MLNNYLIVHLFFCTVDHEVPSKTTPSTKARAPSPPTVRVGHNRLDAPRISQSIDTVTSDTAATAAPVSSIHDTVRSTISTGSFDYLRGPRRCILKVDRNKGLGFVLSATGDYDHTITAVEKVSTYKKNIYFLSFNFCFFPLLLFNSIQQLILLVYKLMMK